MHPVVARTLRQLPHPRGRRYAKNWAACLIVQSLYMVSRAAHGCGWSQGRGWSNVCVDAHCARPILTKTYSAYSVSTPMWERQSGLRIQEPVLLQNPAGDAEPVTSILK